MGRGEIPVLIICNYIVNDPCQVKERGILMVGESGIFTPDDVAYVQDVSGVVCVCDFACFC